MAATRVDIVQGARTAAGELLDRSSPRWRHVLAVARLAETVGQAFGSQRDTLVAAGLLHDIGYAQALRHTGFHPLDGARFVRGEGLEHVALLVAHHSGARHEARLRGLEDFEAEFPYGGTALDDALTYCDLTTSPHGTRVRLTDRVAEIATRYGPDHTVTRAILFGVPEFERAVAATERRLAEAGLELSGSLAYPA